MMAKKYLLGCSLCAGLFLSAAIRTSAQDSQGPIRVNVNLVQLNVAVTDHDGNYVTGLRPQDFAIGEDKIPQKVSTFEEGSEGAVNVVQSAARDNGPSGSSDPQSIDLPAEVAAHASAEKAPQAVASPFTDANVFILFDTSNYMYRGFVFAQDAIAGFIRSLQSSSKIAFYSYSRDLSRSALLTADRQRVLQGVRGTVAGDNAALYNCLLLTVKDAARIVGRKVIVVFSNGPDDASVVPPEDVAELAQSTGTVIYMISTREAQLEPISTAVFERMSKATGGKAYFAKSWRDENKAFAAIRDDLAHLYSISYYPQPNPNRGWRTITVKLVGKDLQKYHVRTRDGYRLQQVKASEEDFAEAGSPETAADPN
ncbi:VWFA-related protein [Silvibacterium bohemicum]|uniref:VWFA-related protein n=1 Tax=Silvibacterium bohemicum TaxID=1577686 RepID=A0A841JWI2_9BACT|nr:VWA domain-containing protein [Silvibacterium bohemicum]MBB6145763.1 VWFA-related protein [Silvibacterium bohemicum]